MERRVVLLFVVVEGIKRQYSNEVLPTRDLQTLDYVKDASLGLGRLLEVEITLEPPLKNRNPKHCSRF